MKTKTIGCKWTFVGPTQTDWFGPEPVDNCPAEEPCPNPNFMGAFIGAVTRTPCTAGDNV